MVEPNYTFLNSLDKLVQKGLPSEKKIVQQVNFDDITSLDLIKALNEQFFVATDYRLLFIANKDYSETRKEMPSYQNLGLVIDKFEQVLNYVQR